MTREQIIEEALRRTDPADRAAFLARACEGNESLRTEIERQLNESKSPNSVDDNPHVAETIVHQPGAAATVSLLAQKYKLLEQIGEGGMGTVWAAQQIDPVRRRVAVKLIKPGMDSRQVTSRFAAERQALALMDHPNIAKVLDGGVTADGRPFFVMEYVKGVPLIEFCDQARLTITERLQLMSHVCQAVQHAHQKGIIHRDLKPSNILVCLYDGVPVPKIIDFGLAKALHQPLTEQTLYTAHGMMVGTPLYMSPEQAEFNNLDVDTRTDVYSLGVILYELLTGFTPLDRQRVKDAAWLEILRLIKEDEPATPSTRLSDSQSLPDVAAQRRLEPAQLSRLIRGDLDWIVMKALEKERSRRYATANALGRDIERYLADEPVEARRPTTAYRLTKFVRRNRIPVAAGSLALCALVAGLILSSIGFVRAHKQAEIARIEAARSDQTARFLKEMLNGLDNVNLMGRDTSLLREILDKAASRIGQDLAGEPEVQADLLDTIGNLYCHVGPLEKAEVVAAEAVALRRKILGTENLKTAASQRTLALILWRKGEFKRAEALALETIEIERQLAGVDSVDSAATLTYLSGIHWDLQQYELAESEARESVRILKHNPASEKWQLARSLGFLGRALDSQRKYAEAEAAIQEALAIQKQIFGEEHQEVAQSLRFLGGALRRAGRLDEAESILKQGIAMQRRVADPRRSPFLAWALDELGGLLNDQNRLDDAAQLLHESLEIKQNTLGKSNPNTQGTADFLNDVIRRGGKLTPQENSE